MAYSNSKLGNLRHLKYYDRLLNQMTSKVEYFETASNIYKSLGDTSKALEILKKGRKIGTE
jgi:hypothetical protein